MGCVARPRTGLGSDLGPTSAQTLTPSYLGPGPLTAASLTPDPCQQVTLEAHVGSSVGWLWALSYEGHPGTLAEEPGHVPLPTGSPQVPSNYGR